MIAEPYICIKGQDAGKIEWFQTNRGNERWEGYLGPCWMRYADFEREKLKSVTQNMVHVGLSAGDGYFLKTRRDMYFSCDLINYTGDQYIADSESSRLLKRAEFLKAVCEKENVEWLPKKECSEETTDGKPYPNRDCDITTCRGYKKNVNCAKGIDCPCKCHKPICLCPCHK